MRRREFIRVVGGAAATWPLSALAQQGEQPKRIAVLTGGAADDPDSQARIAAFVQGLQELGWADGHNLRIDIRWGSGNAADVKRFAAELVALAPDVILATGTTVGALQQASRTVLARPLSLISGRPMDKIEWGPNWEEILGGEFDKRSQDYNFEAVQKDIYGQFENTFMMYLPRLCEHCLNPSCVASCPSGSIYKREEDGIVLIDQDKCRGWRMCVSGCPYKKIYYNWTSGKAEKCIFCYPRIEAGQPTVCSETCVGRIRYLGVPLYDADGIERAAAVEDPQDLYEAQLALFLDPNNPEIAAQARADGVPDAWIEGARRSPTYKMAVDWRIAFPLHPEYRTLPMVWYVPPLSPIQSHANAGAIDTVGQLPDVRSLRIPVRYLANLLTAGAEAPIIAALERMLAMRAYYRQRQLGEGGGQAVLKQVGITVAQVEEMHRYLSIANYEDRF